MVTDMCRGCIAHQCQGACPKEAIEFDEHLKAHIDKKKCIECGQCARVCPYNAINNFRRPCETACQAGAIHMAETCEAEIDYEKCTGCGACVSKCPFGAPVDKSHITDVVKMLKERVVGREKESMRLWHLVMLRNLGLPNRGKLWRQYAIWDLIQYKKWH